MKLHAVEAGRGSPVCLLHGLFGRARNLGAVARGLAGAHRVVSLDVRNHGESPHASGMSYRVMSDDVFETLGALGALPCAVLGHSMGGKVAMAMALRAPGEVSSLVVADIAPVAYVHRNASVAAAMQNVALGLDRAGADRALADAVPDAGVRAFLLQNWGSAGWKIGLDEIAQGMAEIEGWPGDLAGARYAGPALFVRGGKSDYVSDWPAVQKLFPQAKLATVEQAGHWLHADAPQEFLALVSAALP